MFQPFVFKMPDGRRCASAASVACCLLPWKRSAEVCHLVAAGTLCKSEGWKRADVVVGTKALNCNDVRMKMSKVTCWTCGSLAKEVLATAWLCSSSRWAVNSPSSISTRPAQKRSCSCDAPLV